MMSQDIGIIVPRECTFETIAGQIQRFTPRLLYVENGTLLKSFDSPEKVPPGERILELQTQGPDGTSHYYIRDKKTDDLICCFNQGLYRAFVGMGEVQAIQKNEGIQSNGIQGTQSGIQVNARAVQANGKEIPIKVMQNKGPQVVQASQNKIQLSKGTQNEAPKPNVYSQNRESKPEKGKKTIIVRQIHKTEEGNTKHSTQQAANVHSNQNGKRGKTSISILNQMKNPINRDSPYGTISRKSERKASQDRQPIIVRQVHSDDDVRKKRKKEKKAGHKEGKKYLKDNLEEDGTAKRKKIINIARNIEPITPIGKVFTIKP